MMDRDVGVDAARGNHGVGDRHIEIALHSGAALVFDLEDHSVHALVVARSRVLEQTARGHGRAGEPISINQ